jgi:DNA-binding GntR family transcriptional regulator
LEGHSSREPVREGVRKLLLDRLLARELAPGERLNEAELASEFGISRTPLREALLQLASDGLVESRPGLGFFVAGMDPATARDLYGVVGLLEALALRRSGQPDPATLQRLRGIDARRDRRPEEYDGVRKVDLDMEWHHTLVESCPNQPLLELLEVCRQRLFRFEYVHASEFARVGTTGLEQHARVLGELEAGHVERAADLLREHWEHGACALSDWLAGTDLSEALDQTGS